MGNAFTFLNAQAVGLTSVANRQYDGQMGAFHVLDYSNNSATWNPRIQRFHEEYLHYVNTIANPDGKIQQFLNHNAGFLEDVLRSTSRAPVSAQAIIDITANSGYMTSDFGDPLNTQEFSREVAYALETLISFQRAGNTLSGAQITRRHTLIGYLKGHLAIWANNTGTYCRPFMAAISCRTAIMYYTHVSQDADIITKVAALADYLWTTCWRENSGAWGPGQSFTYTDRTGFDAEDGNTQPDLNAIICPLYAWLWYQTGVQIHRDRHDAIFTGGIPVYSGNVHTGGAFQGTPSSPALKQIYQQCWWAPQGIAWAESEPLVGGGPEPDPEPEPQPNPIIGRSVQAWRRGKGRRVK
jgi:hypothetical protein